MSNLHDTGDNHSYQAKLALSLIATLGVDGAIRACQENCWHGVLDYLLPADKDDVLPDA